MWCQCVTAQRFLSVDSQDHTWTCSSCGDWPDASLQTKLGPDCYLQKPGSILYNRPRPGVKFYFPLYPTVRDKSPLNMFHPSHGCHIPHPSNGIYELIDRTMTMLPSLITCGRLNGKQPPCACSDVISGGQSQVKYCIRRRENTSWHVWKKSWNMIWQCNKDFFMPQMYVFKHIFVCDDADAILG